MSSVLQKLNDYEKSVAVEKKTKRNVFYNSSGKEYDLGTMDKCLKYTVLITNLFFVICGLAIAISGFILVNSSVLSLTGAEVAIFFAAVGLLIALLSSIGCCGALKESRFLMHVYHFCLVVVIVVQIAAIVFVTTQREKLSNLLEQGWSKASESLRGQIQNNFNCCGYLDGNDRAALPCPETAVSGCLEVLSEDIKTKFTWFLVGVAVVLIVEVSTLVLSCCLSNRVKSAMLDAKIGTSVR